MTYKEALQYLESFVNYESAPKPQAMRRMRLDRMRRLCRRLGDPQRSFRSIVVAGTNGKGSISAMIYSMLKQTSLRVGLYTSPHIQNIRERIRIWPPSALAEPRSGQEDWISEEAFTSAVERLQPELEAMRASVLKDAPTYFEVLTAIAFSFFSQRQTDVAVLEVGLGGRLDATNVVEQSVSIIGPLSIDHAQILGEDVAHIAKEKAGIIKPGQIVVTAPQTDDAMEVLRVTCEAHGVPLLRCGQEFSVEIERHDWEGLQANIAAGRGRYRSQIPLVGRHQAQNAACAVAAVEALSEIGIPYSMVEQGLAQVEWPGRIEVVNESPLVILDGAHNPASAQALAETLGELASDRRIFLLLGMSADKDVATVGKILGANAASVTCTQSRHPRSLSASQLAKKISGSCADINVMSDPVDACTYLLNAVSPKDVIVATGSFFLVGELRASFRNASGRTRRAVESAA